MPKRIEANKEKIATLHVHFNIHPLAISEQHACTEYNEHQFNF